MLVADETTLSPAKAKIEAAKRAQSEKLAKRGYGELATAPPAQSSAAAKPKEVTKTFAELLAASVEQRETLTGRLSENEIQLLEKKLRAAYPGLE